MNFNFILKLEEQALMKSADTLWTGHCIEKLLLHCENLECTPLLRRWSAGLEEIVDGIMRNIMLPRISIMVIPEIIKRKLLCITRCVGFQKIDWGFYHLQLWGITKPPSLFYWTAQGCIDRQKTAEILVKDITISVCKRYAMACFYCIETEIRTLNGGNPHRCKECPEKYGNELRNFWNRILMQEQRNGAGCSDIEHSCSRLEENNEIIKTFRDAYKYSLLGANSISAEYFLNKLSLEEYNLQEREDDRIYYFNNMLMNYFTGSFTLLSVEQYLDITFYLMKQMTMDQQIKVLRDLHRMKPMLTIFLNWPFHTLFFQAAHTFRNYISEMDAMHLLSGIMKGKIELFKGFNNSEIVNELWKFVPLPRKANKRALDD